MTFSTSAVAVCCCSDPRDPRLRLNLLEQPRVLDRDHRLVGEGLQQFARRRGRTARRPARHADEADRGALVYQGHKEHGAIAAQPREVAQPRRPFLGVGELRDLAFVEQGEDGEIL